MWRSEAGAVARAGEGEGLVRGGHGKGRAGEGMVRAGQGRVRARLG